MAYKRCPLKAPGQVEGADYCLEEECAWFNVEDQVCAILGISNDLGEMCILKILRS